MIVNYLPFNLPPELCELILKELTGRDLLNSILVSSVWKDFILQSNCFEKVVLRIDQSSELESVLQSKRKYQNLRLLKIDHEKFFNCLSTLGSSAKKIAIIGCCAVEAEQFYSSKLQELTLSNVPAQVLKSIAFFHENLKVLNLHDLKLKPGEESTVINLMKLNRNLTELNLYLNDSCNIFHQDISNISSFNLAAVTISFKSNFDIDARTLTNIEKFLKSQGKSLKTIELINAASLSSIYRLWNFLSAVERLHFFSADPFFDLDSQRPEPGLNARIKALEIHVLGPIQLNINDIKPLLIATKILKSFGVWNMSKELIEYSATNLMNLENLFCATIESDWERFYEQLKSKNGINKKMKLHQYL